MPNVLSPSTTPTHALPDGYRLRPAERADAAAAAALLARSFGRPWCAAHWRWKLFDGPAGRCDVPRVWLVVDRDDRPAFHYAGLTLRGGGRADAPAWEARVAVDGATAPDHRRRGLLSAAAGAIHARWAAAGVACVLGIPSETFGSRRQALGWLPQGALVWRLALRRPQRVARRRLGALGRLVPPLPALGPRTARRRRADDAADALVVDSATALGDVADALDAFDARVDAWAPAARPRRDARWLAWRHLAAPDDDGTAARAPLHLIRRGPDGAIAAGAALRLTDTPSGRWGFVPWIEAVDNDALDALSAQLRSALDDADATAAALLVAPGTAWARALARRGWRTAWGGPFGVHRIAGAVADDGPAGRCDVPRVWLVVDRDDRPAFHY
ncbi:MAG: hypothetical protein AAF772_17000, partial [Acidobacteriota bacterium]